MIDTSEHSTNLEAAFREEEMRKKAIRESMSSAQTTEPLANAPLEQPLETTATSNKNEQLTRNQQKMRELFRISVGAEYHLATDEQKREGFTLIRSVILTGKIGNAPEAIKGYETINISSFPVEPIDCLQTYSADLDYTSKDLEARTQTRLVHLEGIIALISDAMVALPDFNAAELWSGLTAKVHELKPLNNYGIEPATLADSIDALAQTETSAESSAYYSGIPLDEETKFRTLRDSSQRRADVLGTLTSAVKFESIMRRMETLITMKHSQALQNQTLALIKAQLM